jgi:hypothetical protein
MMSWGKRQDVDIYEMHFQWAFFAGFCLAFPLAHMKYGVCVTKQRQVKLGLRFGLLNALASVVYTYCMCPVAQEPNRGTLQFNSWEQGFKNYID